MYNLNKKSVNCVVSCISYIIFVENNKYKHFKKKLNEKNCNWNFKCCFFIFVYK